MRRFQMAALAIVSAAIVGLTGCANATPSVNANGEKITKLKIGHNLAEDHAVNIAIEGMADEIKKTSGDTVEMQIYPNGILGSETDMILQIQAGALDMAKVSASTLGNFSSEFNAFSVPYVFDDRDHFYKFMDSDVAKEVFQSTRDQGFIALTWLDSGARSFYTAKRAIREPSDLKGLKIRTMDSKMAIEMMKDLGGSATVMGYSDIYTGLQQGVIDGAENNITALRDHGEVSKYYCYDEHTRIPDIVIISTKVWDSLTPEQQEELQTAANNMTEKYKKSWADFEAQVKQDAESKFHVTFVEDVDKAAFQKACQPIYDELKTSDPDCYKVVEAIRGMADSAS